jgi:hypothetical protein
MVLINTLMRFINILFCLILSLELYATAQVNLGYKPIPGWDQLTSKQRLEQLRFTTTAYRQEAFERILSEANCVAKALDLPESFPITKNDVEAFFISPPRYDQMYSQLGNITTRNYIYFVSVDNKFCEVIRTHYDDELQRLMQKYHKPIWQVNTNAAYQLATQFLASVSMDVDGLNRDCQRTVFICQPDDQNKYFVPNYSVVWSKKEIIGCVAKVEIFIPTKTLRDLTVNQGKYILRKPLEITNLDFLLSQTNAPSGTNAPAPP